MHNVARRISVILLFAVITAGCAGVKEGARGFWGVSTQALEDGRQDAERTTSALDQHSCFMAVHKILKDIGTYVYHLDENRHFIAVYVSASDTTPVGVFVSAHEAGSLVEVSSRSSYAKELIAGKLFPELAK